MSNTDVSPLIQALARDTVKQLTPYASARRSATGGTLWLNANESPYVDEYDLTDTNLNLYPQCQPKSVLTAYSDYAGLKPEQIVISRGADEGIELLIRAFCEPNIDSIVICPPTYGMYAISAESIGVNVINAPLIDKSFALDMDAISAALAQKVCPKIIFICSPNNPTGGLVDQQQITAVLELAKNKALVVVDEAYIEFSPQSTVTPLLARYDNLVILRTLSKAFALAGLRCGFTLARPAIVNTLLKVIAPYPVAAPVADIATQALQRNGIETMQSRTQLLNQTREKFADFLRQQSNCLEVFSSDANFVLSRWTDVQPIYRALLDQGILVRDQSKQLYLNNSLRFTIGSPEQMEMVMQVLTNLSEDIQA